MIVIFDLDGTLALIQHRRPLVEGPKKDWAGFFKACVDDKPYEAVIETYNALRDQGHTMWIYSGRSDEVEQDTVSWLYDNDIEFARLRMRGQGDHQPDEKLKMAWLKRDFPIDYKSLLCVFEDRDRMVKMWRNEGIPCFQVAPGDF